MVRMALASASFVLCAAAAAHAEPRDFVGEWRDARTGAMLRIDDAGALTADPKLTLAGRVLADAQSDKILVQDRDLSCLFEVSWFDRDRLTWKLTGEFISGAGAKPCPQSVSLENTKARTADAEAPGQEPPPDTGGWWGRILATPPKPAAILDQYRGNWVVQGRSFVIDRANDVYYDRAKIGKASATTESGGNLLVAGNFRDKAYQCLYSVTPHADHNRASFRLIPQASTPDVPCPQGDFERGR